MMGNMARPQNVDFMRIAVVPVGNKIYAQICQHPLRPGIFKMEKAKVPVNKIQRKKQQKKTRQRKNLVYGPDR